MRAGPTDRDIAAEAEELRSGTSGAPVSALKQLLEEMTSVLLDEAVSPGDVKNAADVMYEVFSRNAPVEGTSVPSALPTGAALSPRMAALCVTDAMRTAVFLRGIEQALREAEPREVLYAGTGPFAALVMSLIGRFPNVRFTLLDIHQQSIESVRALASSLEYTNCTFVVADATTYQHPVPIDLCIVETMQAALAREPQVAIVRHLGPQLAPAGILIPRRVTVDAVLVDGAAETRRALGQEVPPHARIHLGTVVDLGAREMKFELTALVPDHHHTLAWFTRVEVFGRHELGEYQSGITYPQMLWNVSPEPGAILEFRYEMGPAPGITFRVRSIGAEKWIRKRLPSLQCDDETLRTRLEQAMTQAGRKGYREPAAIRLYVLLMFALGRNFDDRPRVREYLASAVGTPDERLLDMAAGSHPDCWLREDSAEWDELPRGPHEPIEWPDTDPFPPQLQAGYGLQLDVPWYATPEPAVAAMLTLAELAPSDFLLDLGCGDGRIAISAAKQYGVRGRGIDIDPNRVMAANEAAVQAGVSDLVSFQCLDLFDAVVSDATVVILYLLGEVNVRIREKLRAQLRPGSRIISRSFDMEDWPPETAIQTAFGPIYRWRT